MTIFTTLGPAFAKAMVTLASASLLTASAIAAGEADGVYQIKRISTSDSFPVPKNLIAEAIASNNTITIRDNQISIQRKRWGDVLDHFNFVFSGGTAKITGPKSITLEPSGESFTGKTTRPIVAKLTGSFLGTEIQMTLKATCSAKLIGDKLSLTLPVRISTDGEAGASGTVRVIAERP